MGSRIVTSSDIRLSKQVYVDVLHCTDCSTEVLVDLNVDFVSEISFDCTNKGCNVINHRIITGH